MIKKTILWLALTVMVAGYNLTAQEQVEGDNPPEVLTSELTLKTLLESETLQVNFVVVDSDQVTEVTINGEQQVFEPADTVMITKEFTFTEDVSQVEVVAKDEQGNSKRVIYTVYGPGVDPAVAGKKVEGLQWFVTYDVRVEQDDNPSNDLSSPIDIEGIELVGVVPDDEQTDSRTNLLVMGGISSGPWNAYVGVMRINYGKEDFAERFDVEINMLGGAYRTPDGGFEAGLLFSDIDLGVNDYALTQTISPGWRVLGKDEDGTTQTLWGADIILKDFANQDVQENTTVVTLKWTYNTLDNEKQDSYRRAIVLGTASEGILESEFNFIGIDMDWNSKWDSGVLWDIGFGVHYRDYENEEPLSKETFLGDTRVDTPIRFSTGLGWEFTPNIRVMGNYQYTFNLSNKSPFVRQIIGVGLNGRF